MKKLFMYLSLLVMPFALAGNKESVKEVKAEVDTNATITIGENTFSRVTTSNMDKIKDGAKVMLVTDNPYGQLIVSSHYNESSKAPFSYTVERMPSDVNYCFTVNINKNGKYELSISIKSVIYKIYCTTNTTGFSPNPNLFKYYTDSEGATLSKYTSEYDLTTSFNGNANDYPVFTNQGRTFYSSTGSKYSLTVNPEPDSGLTLYATTSFYDKSKSTAITGNTKYGTPSIYVLNEASFEPTNEEKAVAFINKWKAYDADFCANLKDDTKRAELQTLIAEYDALNLEVKALVDATIIKDGVTVANQIEYVRNSLAITKSENTSQSLVNIITTNNSTMTYVLILSIATISLISYAFVLKTKKNK